MAAEQLPRSGRPNWPWALAGVALVALVASAAGAWWHFRQPPDGPPDPSDGRTFDGSSEDLRQTAIVPTLDTPMPKGKSVIWCASFQAAWNKLKGEVGGPVRIKNAEEVAGRLNRAEQSEDDLPPGSFCTAAGRGQETVDRIRADMARLFPDAPPPAIPEGPHALVAYGYLRAGVKFEHPYFEEPRGFPFRDWETVGGFGIREEHEGAYQELRDQYELLYRSPADNPWGAQQYAIDLCRHSQPNQVVLAVVPRGETLHDVLTDLDRKVAQWKPHEMDRRLKKLDVLRVPNMHWRVRHHFRELEGADKVLLNYAPGQVWLDTALQAIEFKLDRGGAELSSEAAIHFKGGPREFHFDRPFLLYLKKRGAKHPFFVMWADNAELLQKR